MPYRGHLENGVVKPDEAFPWSDGTEVVVDVSVLEEAKSADSKPQTLYERLKPFIGMVDDLPEDMAKNHDHYIHGTPKL